MKFRRAQRHDWVVRQVDFTWHTHEEAGLDFIAVTLTEHPDGGGKYLEFQLGTDEVEREEGYCIVDSPAPVTMNSSRPTRPLGAPPSACTGPSTAA